jgi:hypothetical protein
VSSTQHGNRDHLVTRVVLWGRRHAGDWYLLGNSLMRSCVIEVHHVCSEETGELLFMKDEEVIQAFSPHAQEKAFADGIRSWSSLWRSKHFDATWCCHPCTTLPEFAVMISQQICWPLFIRSRLVVARPKNRSESASPSPG